VFLWKYRAWKSVAFAALPYVIVAIPLCLYNYVRFESIFEFGSSYQLTVVDIKAVIHQNVLSKIFRIILSSANYLFCPIQLSMNFPFVGILQTNGVQITQGVLCNFVNPIGIINFPIVFCLSYLFKNTVKKDTSKTTYPLLWSSLIVAIAIIILNSLILGCGGGYMVDFAIFIVLPSCFCAYYWCQDTKSCDLLKASHSSNTFVGFTVRLSLIYALITASVFIGLFLTAASTNSYSNPTLYRYLETALGCLK